MHRVVVVFLDAMGRDERVDHHRVDPTGEHGFYQSVDHGPHDRAIAAPLFSDNELHVVLSVEVKAPA